VLRGHAGRERVIDDADVQTFTIWFHNDRELHGGGTPAERYASRSELPANECAVALRIAAARLGIYRVLAVEPEVSLLLDDVLGGGYVEVRSENVSRGAVSSVSSAASRTGQSARAMTASRLRMLHGSATSSGSTSSLHDAEEKAIDDDRRMAAHTITPSLIAAPCRTKRADPSGS
jgi:hypothetical protein